MDHLQLHLTTIVVNIQVVMIPDRIGAMQHHLVCTHLGTQLNALIQPLANRLLKQRISCRQIHVVEWTMQTEASFMTIQKLLRFCDQVITPIVQQFPVIEILQF